MTAKFLKRTSANHVRNSRLGAHDLIIAAAAISFGSTIITTNVKDFINIEGIRVEKFLINGKENRK